MSRARGALASVVARCAQVQGALEVSQHAPVVVLLVAVVDGPARKSPLQSCSFDDSVETRTSGANVAAPSVERAR